jgi:hypothetical protein
MTSNVPAALRRLVAERAGGVCEYCLLHEDDTFFGCQIEHVIAEKHGGATTADNLAYACVFCNRRKGSDIATLSPTTGSLTRLFNPRTDRWPEHFEFGDDQITIHGRTEVGAATVRLLDLNHPDRLVERHTLRLGGRYPSPAAISRLGG